MSGYSGSTTTFQCRHCGAHSSSDVIASEPYIETIYEDDGSAHSGPEYRYRLVRCTACTDLTLLLAMEIIPDLYDDDVSVYPSNPRYLSGAVPKVLREAFTEARICYQAKAYTASAIMCRRSLESLAANRGVTGKNLAVSLKKLQENGDIDQRLFDWADALRLAGNDAAHDVGSSVSQTDARDMNDLAEAILDYVYVFQARYESFVNRRKSGTAEL